VGDAYGVLIRSMAAPTLSKPPDTLSPYETALRFFLYRPTDNLAVRGALDRAVQLERATLTPGPASRSSYWTRSAFTPQQQKVGALVARAVE
jgi:hypothetical protein